MGIFDNFFKIKKLPAGSYRLQDGITFALDTETAYKTYAISICINKIANALSQCTFDTYLKKNLNKGDNWYIFNVEPNRNQNITDFWNKLILEMVINPDGALVIQTYEGDFLIADNYSIKEFALYGNKYTDVVVGNLRLNRTFDETEVLRFKLNNSNIYNLIDSVYDSYGKLLTSAMKNYNRKNAKKVFVKISSMFEQFKTKINEETGQTEYDETMDDIFKNRLKGYFSESDSATPLEEGLEIVDSSQGSTSKGGNSDKTGIDTDDIRSVFDDILNICADAFNIPRGLLKGSVADVEAMTDNFIAFCINPIASLIEDEINRKLYGKKHVLEGTKIKIKTTTIKSYDPTKFAASAEALYRIRSVNTNWVRSMIGEEPIEEDWADEYMETKNYQKVNQHLERSD